MQRDKCIGIKENKVIDITSSYNMRRTLFDWSQQTGIVCRKTSLTHDFEFNEFGGMTSLFWLLRKFPSSAEVQCANFAQFKKGLRATIIEINKKKLFTY
jgi:hypothetical protein